MYYCMYYSFIPFRSPEFRNLGMAASTSSPSLECQFVEKNYEILGKLGRGGFGSVFKVKHRLDQKIYALKKVRISVLDERLNIQKEVEHLSVLNHKHIVQYGYSFMVEESDPHPSSQGISKAECQIPSTPDENIQRETDGTSFSRIWAKDVFGIDSNGNDLASQVAVIPFVYIQMEFCPTTLRKCIEENRYTEAWEVARIISQIFEALTFIHSKGIIHRDLKPENIFITDSGLAKIGDFGLSTRLPDDRSKSLTDPVGSNLYMAPEVKNSKNYDHRCDMYSFGIVYFETIHPPFRTQAERIEVLSNLRKEEIQFPSDWKFFDWENQTQQIRRLLHHAPDRRILLEYELIRACTQV